MPEPLTAASPHQAITNAADQKKHSAAVTQQLEDEITRLERQLAKLRQQLYNTQHETEHKQNDIASAFSDFSTDDTTSASASHNNTTTSAGQPYTYASSGVDIDAGDALVQNIKPLVAATKRLGVPGKADEMIGGFGGVFDIGALGLKDPVLVSGTDGVGTKLFLAQSADNHRTIGIDLVAMSVNDIIVQGAEPLYFLDYFATSRLHVQQATDVVAGIAAGCKQSGCALIGGETAEMPGLYQPGEYDLAGFAVGAVERHALLPRMSGIQAGAVLVGLASSGLHSNGFSLVRKVISSQKVDMFSPPPFKSNHKRLVDELLTPTKLYITPLVPLLKASSKAAAQNEAPNDYGILGLAHITGGGLTENIPRVLPKDLQAVLDASSWQYQIPPVFPWLQSMNVAPSEMVRTFNCGIGMVMVVDNKHHAEQAIEQLQDAGQEASIIGSLQQWQNKDELQVKINNLDQLFPQRV